MSTTNLNTLRRLFFYAFVVPFTLSLPASALRAELLAHNEQSFSQAGELSSLSDVAKQIQGQLEEFLADQPDSENAQELQSLHAQVKQLAQSGRELSEQEAYTLNTAIDSALSYMSTLPQETLRARNNSVSSLLRGLKLLNCRLINISNRLVNLTNTVNTLVTTINTDEACAPVKPINSVPFTITQSGKYCLTQDVTYSGTDAAITIAADNVHLNLSNHNITLTDPAATCISIDGRIEVTIENDSIRSANPTSQDVNNASVGIRINNSKDITVKHININNLSLGIYITNSQGVSITDSYFLNMIAGGILANDSDDIVVEDSKFVSTLAFNVVDAKNVSQINNRGVTFSSEDPDNLPGCSNCRISRSEFSGTFQGIPIFPRQVNGFILEDSLVFVNNSTFSAAFVQVGSPGRLNDAGQRIRAAKTNGVIIRNSSFTSTTLAAGADGIILGNGRNAVLENVSVKINSAVNTKASSETANGALSIGASEQPAGLVITGAVGNPEALFTNIRVFNSVFNNPGNRGIYMTSGTSDVTIESSVISNNLVGIQLNGTHNVTLKDNDIQDNAQEGILLRTTFPVSGVTILAPANNAIQDNRISRNGTDGISVNGSAVIPGAQAFFADSNLVEHNVVSTNGANGIVLNANTTNNFVRENLVFSNTTGGIVNNGPVNPAANANQFTYNEVYNNNPNYTNVPAIVAQGDPAVAGQNIDLGL